MLERRCCAVFVISVLQIQYDAFLPFCINWAHLGPRVDAMVATSFFLSFAALYILHWIAHGSRLRFTQPTYWNYVIAGIPGLFLALALTFMGIALDLKLPPGVVLALAFTGPALGDLIMNVLHHILGVEFASEITSFSQAFIMFLGFSVGSAFFIVASDIPIHGPAFLLAILSRMSFVTVTISSSLLRQFFLPDENVLPFGCTLILSTSVFMVLIALVNAFARNNDTNALIPWNEEYHIQSAIAIIVCVVGLLASVTMDIIDSSQSLRNMNFGKILGVALTLGSIAKLEFAIISLFIFVALTAIHATLIGNNATIRDSIFGTGPMTGPVETLLDHFGFDDGEEPDDSDAPETELTASAPNSELT